MRDIHRSEKIDILIGHSVCIEFFDGYKCQAQLEKYIDGYYYATEANKSWRFRKTHIKK